MRRSRSDPAAKPSSDSLDAVDSRDNSVETGILFKDALNPSYSLLAIVVVELQSVRDEEVSTVLIVLLNVVDFIGREVLIGVL